MHRLAYILFLSILVACGNKQSRKLTNSDSVSILQSTPPKVIAANSVADAVLQFFPADTTFAAQILWTGSFHKEEVMSSDSLHTWMGIFFNRDGYYVKETRIKLKNVNDDELDEHGEKTGWEVSTLHKDSSVLLISGLENLKNDLFRKIRFNKTEFIPGDSFTYKDNGTSYNIYATGQKKPDHPGSNSYMLYNYRLSIKAQINGANYNELLFATNESEFGCSVIMAGDIDNDGIPDLILNTSTESNIYTVSLYLSSLAKKGHLLKIAGMRTIVGC